MDLGWMPSANAYLTPAELEEGKEQSFPLHAKTCLECKLVQLDSIIDPADLFDDYAYFSSYSESAVSAARSYVDDIVSRFSLGPDTMVIEIASNDGYLLQHLVRRAVPVLGVDPAANVASLAIAKGVPTHVAYFGSATAELLLEDGFRGHFVIANNVLAHVPDLHDFVAGMALLLQKDGVASIEFPHLLRLITNLQFDTIYHEHFSYFSLLSLEPIFHHHGLRIVDIEELPTHGGSLRVYCTHDSNNLFATSAVENILTLEENVGLHTTAPYELFAARVEKVVREFREFLARCQESRRSVVGYGAAAKGNTYLNYVGADASDIPFVADRSVYKQGRLLPASHIPVVSPDRIFVDRPDLVLILPWNLRNEVTEQLAAIKDWGGRFCTASPTVQIY